WIFRAIILLRFIAPAREDSIEQTGRDLIRHDRFYRGPADIKFTARMMGREMNRFRGHLGLKDWRDRLRFAWQAALHPTELRRVQRGKLDHRHADTALVVNQLAAQRFCKTFQSVLRSAVGGLQWNRAISESGTDLDDDAAITRQHSL